MTKFRRRLEEVLWATGLHGVARAAYSVTAGRRTNAAHRFMKVFYRDLLPSGCLVFDIGANVGAFSAIFSSLGARVVALEPNADCVRHIQLSYDDSAIAVIQAVAGPQDGLATLNLSDMRDDLSSISTSWIDAIQSKHSEYRGLWSKQIEVPMLRLDTLVERFGIPHFIKIDVEGFEEGVLDGLSTQPAVLSFEFNSAYLEAAHKCLEKRLFATTSEFNFAIGDPIKLELESWVRKDQLKEALAALDSRAEYGDIFVRAATHDGGRDRA